jgi:hypothetical protein
VPGRGLVSIQQLVAELNHLQGGAALSKDRLTRVTQGGERQMRSTLPEVSPVP